MNAILASWNDEYRCYILSHEGREYHSRSDGSGFACQISASGSWNKLGRMPLPKGRPIIYAGGSLDGQQKIS